MTPLQLRRLARAERRAAREARRIARQQRLDARNARRAARALRVRNRFWFYPYKAGSKSCSAFTRLVNGKQLKLVGSKYRPRAGDVVVNWGSIRCPEFSPATVLNRAGSVGVAVSKLATFNKLRLAGVNVPDWTRDRNEAQGWLATGKIMARDADTGRAGVGITVYKKGTSIDQAHMFYTRYFKKTREFRLHVFKDAVIFSQEKRKKVEGFDPQRFDPYIRSHDRGWVFCHTHFGGEPIPSPVSEGCVQAVAALGLQFGAVDVGYNEESGYCVFEVNTAPGLEGETLNAYAKALRAA